MQDHVEVQRRKISRHARRYLRLRIQRQSRRHLQENLLEETKVRVGRLMAGGRYPAHLAASIGFENRKNVSGRILEPGNGRSVSAHDSFFVSLKVRFVVN